MRKKTVNFTIEKIFWYLLLLLPLIFYLVWLCSVAGSFEIGSYDDLVFGSMCQGSAFMTFIDLQGLSFVSSNVIYSTFQSLFGIGGAFPDFGATSNAVIWYMTFIVHMYIFRILVDVLVFLPEVCDKFKRKLLGE